MERDRGRERVECRGVRRSRKGRTGEVGEEGEGREMMVSAFRGEVAKRHL